MDKHCYTSENSYIRVIPTKYLLILIVMHLVGFPVLLYLVSFVGFFILSFGNTIEPLWYMLLYLPVGAILMLFWIFAPRHGKVVFQNGSIASYIDDGLSNHGWIRELSDVRSAELVDKSEVQKYYKKFKKKKAILIDFGNNDIKYIYADCFSKRQITRIICILNRETN